MALFLAACSALVYGVGDFFGGFATARSRVLSVLLISQAMGVAVALAALAILGPGLPLARDLGWGLVAGFTGSVGLFLLYAGLAKGIVAVVSPASAVMGAVIPVLFALALGERPATASAVGCALCLPAILLLTWERGAGSAGAPRVRSSLGCGLLAGVGFGAFFVALSRCSPGAGLWPLVAARAASISACGAALLVSRERVRLDRAGLFPALAAGIADMGANILFLLASQRGMLSLVAVITSLYPAPTVLMARVVLGQRIPPVRLAGLALALTGVGLISLR